MQARAALSAPLPAGPASEVTVQLVVAVVKGDVAAVRSALQQSGIDLRAKVNGKTAADTLLSREFKSDEDKRYEIGWMLLDAGDNSSKLASFLVRMHSHTHAHIQSHTTH